MEYSEYKEKLENVFKEMGSEDYFRKLLNKQKKEFILKRGPPQDIVENTMMDEENENEQQQ